MKRGLALALAALVLCLAPAACGPGPGPGGAQGAAPARSSRPAIAGTAVDARTGEVLGGVKVAGPDGAHTVSKPNGRFALEGLAVGARGSVVGTLEDGRRAERAVGPLAAGQRLEIVLRLGPR